MCSILVFYRSYLGILLVTDLVLADVDIEWTIHLPLMLHVAVLGKKVSVSLNNSRLTSNSFRIGP